jgi:hypothetical protein
MAFVPRHDALFWGRIVRTPQMVASPRFREDLFGVIAARPGPEHLRWTTPSAAPGERVVNHYRVLLAELAKRSRSALFLSDSALDPLVGQAPKQSCPFCNGWPRARRLRRLNNHRVE